MTWTRLSAEFADDPALLEVSRGARLLHVEALIFANRHGTDGAIPRFALPRVTDEPIPEDAAAELVRAGKWRATPTGWEVVAFLEDQPAAAQVAREKSLKARRQRRFRLHSLGDHSECLARSCRGADDGSNDASRDASSDATPPARPPDRPQGRTDDKGDGAAAGASERPAPRLLTGEERAAAIADNVALLDDSRTDPDIRHAAERTLERLGATR